MLRRLFPLAAFGASLLLAQDIHDYTAESGQKTPGPHVTHIKYILKNVGGRVDWLPNSKLIAYDTPNQTSFTDVFVMNSDGSNQHCVTCGISALTEYKGNPAWIPSGKYILFQATDPTLPKQFNSHAQFMQVTSPGSGWHNNLWVVTADGTKAYQLTHVNVHQGLIHAHFDNSGTRITWAQLDRAAGQSHWSIKIATFTDQGGSPQLTNVKSYTPGNLSFYETHGFSEGGTQVIFSGKSQGFSASHLNWGIFSFNIETGTLTTLADPGDNDWNEHAHYTPDGKHVIWMSSTGIAQNKAYEGESITSPFVTLKTDYWIMNPDGSNKQRLTYFNDPKSPMYIHGHVIASDLSFNSNTEMVCYIGDNPSPGARHPGEIAIIDLAY